MRKISLVANASTNGAAPNLTFPLLSFLGPAQAPFAHYGPSHQAPTARRISAKHLLALRGAAASPVKPPACRS